MIYVWHVLGWLASLTAILIAVRFSEWMVEWVESRRLTNRSARTALEICKENNDLKRQIAEAEIQRRAKSN
jgi:hypothetical protein